VTEDQINTRSSSQITKPAREPLTKEGFDRAKESIKKAQDTGSWPKKEIPQSIAVAKDTIEKTYPTEKMYPKKEVREKMLASYPGQKETIPPKIKKELTEEAIKLDTITMEPGEKETQKTTELPKVKPFAEKEVAPSTSPQAPEIFKAQGGAEPLKRIMKAQGEMDQEKTAYQESAPERMKTRIEHKQVEVPSEAKSYVPPSQIPLEKPAPQSVVEPTPQEVTQPLKTKQKSFISRTFAKIFRKK
jgi:hypothetical protein